MHHSAKQRRNSHSGRKTRHHRKSGGTAQVGPFAKSLDAKTVGNNFINVLFNRPWFKDMSESQKGTLTDINQTVGNKATGTLTIQVLPENLDKFKIQPPVVTNVEFILNEGSWLGSTVKINGSAFKRPDITRVRYISSGSDFIHGQIKEGGGALMGQAEDSAASTSQSAGDFFKKLGSDIISVTV